MELIEVKCPFSKTSKAPGFEGKLYKCPQICVKVEPGSRGEAWCRRCGKAFYFEVDKQSNYKPYVKVQHENSKQPST